MDFKNSFEWLTGMKKLIFHFNNVFGSGHFFDPSEQKKGQKIAGAKKVFKIKNQFFHGRQPRKGIYEIHSFWGLILTIVCSSFYLSV